MSISNEKQFLVFGENKEGGKVILKLSLEKINRKSEKTPKSKNLIKNDPLFTEDVEWLQRQLCNSDQIYSNRILTYLTESLVAVLYDL